MEAGTLSCLHCHVQLRKAVKNYLADFFRFGGGGGIRSVVFDGLPKIFFLFKENRFVVKTKKIERWYVEATPLWVGVLTRASFQQRRMSLHSAAERVKYE